MYKKHMLPNSTCKMIHMVLLGELKICVVGVLRTPQFNKQYTRTRFSSTSSISHIKTKAESHLILTTLCKINDSTVLEQLAEQV